MLAVAAYAALWLPGQAPPVQPHILPHPLNKNWTCVWLLYLCLQAFSDVFPHLVAASDVPTLVKIADVDFDSIDAVFCCLPHATTQQIIKSLPRHVKIVDLSADFRLADVNTYAEW
jgi:hypothetical protein